MARSLFQASQKREKVVHIGLRKFAEQIAMRGEGILDFNFHAVPRKGAIPAGGVAQADHEIIGMHQLSFDLLARGKRYDGRTMRAISAVSGIKHARFKLDGRIFPGDTSEIAGGRMTILAAAGAVEEGFACVSVAGEQFLEGIPSGNARGLEPFL